jgi:hypothetical protein
MDPLPSSSTAAAPCGRRNPASMAAPAVLVAALSTAVSLSAAPRQARAAEDLLF